MTTDNVTPIQPADEGTPVQPFELLEQLLCLSEKLDVVAQNFKAAQRDNTLPDSLAGEILITMDAADELRDLSSALDEWARENGAPQFGPLNAAASEKIDD